MLLTNKEIQNIPRLKRIHLMNAITGYKSANLIGTVDELGVSNLGVFSSVTHIGSQPPIIGFILRPTTVPRNTYLNIKKTGFYTINSIGADFYKRAHACSAKFDGAISEFEACDLNEEYLDGFLAPFVKESAIKIALEFKEEIHISVNNTILILGQVIHIDIPDKSIMTDGFVDIESLDLVTVSGLDAYYSPQILARLSYARPNQKIEELPHFSAIE